MIDPRNPLGASPTEGVSLYHRGVTTIELPATRGSDGRLSSPINVRAVLVDKNGPDYESLVTSRFDISQKPILTLSPPPINKAWDITVTQGPVRTEKVTTFVANPSNFYRWDQLVTVDPATLEPVPVDNALAEWSAIRDQIETITDQKIAAHVKSATPHAVYDDIPDLTLIFENVVESGLQVDFGPAVPDLTTVFDNNL